MCLVAVCRTADVVDVLRTPVWLLADGAVGHELAADVLAGSLKLAHAVDLEELRARASHCPVEAIPVAMVLFARRTAQSLRSEGRQFVVCGEALDLGGEDGLRAGAHEFCEGDGPRLHVVVVKKTADGALQGVDPDAGVEAFSNENGELVKVGRGEEVLVIRVETEEHEDVHQNGRMAKGLRGREVR